MKVKSSHSCRWARNTFLPATKAMAKEMLPIVDKPTIQFIVEEALDSGIEDILIVTGKEKDPLKITLMQISNWKTICGKRKNRITRFS